MTAAVIKYPHNMPSVFPGVLHLCNFDCVIGLDWEPISYLVSTVLLFHIPFVLLGFELFDQLSSLHCIPLVH